MDNNLQTATLAGGCFWCLEAVFDEVKGVHSVRVRLCRRDKSQSVLS